jgi:large subunit ribosomal protein L18e
VKKTRITNPQLTSLIRNLRKKTLEDSGEIWRDVADRLSTSRRRRTTVNISQLNRYTKVGETVVVPGKVLGAGILDHEITVAAFAFSDLAKAKIRKVKGKCLSIEALKEKNLKGANVKIVG